MPTNSYKINPKATKSIHYTLYYGTFIHTPDLTTLEINFNTLVGVNEQGTIDFIHKDYDASLYNNKSPIQFFIDQREHPHSQHIRKIMANNDINILNLLIIPMI